MENNCHILIKELIKNQNQKVSNILQSRKHQSYIVSIYGDRYIDSRYMDR